MIPTRAPGKVTPPLISPTIDYFVFSDESRHTEGRFRSIAAVSLPASLVEDLSAKLSDVMKCAVKGELKWRNVGRGGKKNVPRATATLDFFLSHLCSGLRLDILIWDTHDPRHAVKARDDVANYSRMFFHLHRNLMKRRGTGNRFHLRPDKLVTINWNTIRDCLNSDGTWRKGTQEILGEEFRWVIPKVATFKEVESALTPFVQLADLIAGMAAYTSTNPETIRTLLARGPNQAELFSEDHTTRRNPSDTDRGRFKVVSHLYNACKSKRLGVSLKTQGYLLTRDPRNPVNFWHYKPQHSKDKAPTKSGTREKIDDTFELRSSE